LDEALPNSICRWTGPSSTNCSQAEPHSRMCCRLRPTAAGASLPPVCALPKWDGINARQRNRAKQSLVVASSSPSHVPDQAPPGATAATLADSVHGTPQRQTHRWRE